MVVLNDILRYTCIVSRVKKKLLFYLRMLVNLLVFDLSLSFMTGTVGILACRVSMIVEGMGPFFPDS